MKTLMFKMMFKYRKNTIILSFLFFFITLLINVNNGIDRINVGVSVLFYFASLYILFNGAYLFLGRITEKSNDFDYYARFIFLIVMYVTCIAFMFVQ